MLKIQEELDKWRNLCRFYLPTKVDAPINDVMQYMIRCLSRGRIPSRDLVEKTLSGEISVPSCRFIGCCLDGEHVH